LTDGTPAEAEYARLNTVYLLGQCPGCSEILRREGQFSGPVDLRRDREVMEAMEEVREALSDSIDLPDPTLGAGRAPLGLPGLCRLRQGPGRQGQGPLVHRPAGGRRPPGRQPGPAPRPPGRPPARPPQADQPARPQRGPGLRPAPPAPLNRQARTRAVTVPYRWTPRLVCAMARPRRGPDGGLQPQTRMLPAWLRWVAPVVCCAAGRAVTLAVTRPLTIAVLVEGAAKALAFPLGYATIGLVLTLRRPAHPIGRPAARA